MVRIVRARWREKWESKRVREREEISGNGSIESAAQRNAPPLCSGLAALRAHHRVRVRQKERKRARARERERWRKKERERDRRKRKGERHISTDQYQTQREEEDKRRTKPSRVGLGQVYPSFTHTALSCVCHPAEENHTKAEAQPLREKEGRREFPVLASDSPK